MTYSPKILIVEDDTDINNLIYKILIKQNYHAVQSFSGTEASLRLDMEQFDLMILDLMLPGMNGEALLHALREEKKLNIPVLILSAKASLQDKVQLLTEGADDYITKPFEPEELLARVLAALRRTSQNRNRQDLPGSNGNLANHPEDNCFSYKNLCLFPDLRKVTVNRQEITLTRHEYDILHILIQSPEKVFSREALYEQVWNGGYYGEDNTVNVHVSNIRKKLAAADSDQEYIKTVWGIGFKMA
ncbi:response regulator transcription factor [Bariatricus sp. SGI.154]|uniref:response regulator transcription factor n=1 Tax=Bariatricus sp. SGI.154 TaxID=3420549 RepID=UPI003D051658